MPGVDHGGVEVSPAAGAPPVPAESAHQAPQVHRRRGVCRRGHGLHQR